MGMLVEGKWTTRWYDTKSTGGRFVRSEAQFRNAVENAPDARFRAEPGRYHLYLADACPWCHRVAVARVVFGLEEVLPVSVVSPWMLEHGWVFDTPEPLYGFEAVHELYTRADPTYTGRVTVPVLWDTVHETIANNESSELIRMLDTEFRPFHTREAPTWRPAGHEAEIDALNDWIYPSINNGVYRCGFATTQAAYDEAVTELFAALDRAEALLEGRSYLVTDHPTEADWRLWVTLVRFDLVYFGHFKCNVRRIADYPNLQAFTKRLYGWPGVAGITVFDAIKTHYYGSHESINPYRIVPRGPNVDF
ncbi:MAG: glutathione S-transferase family protein [Myxococcota bacterium]